MITIRFINIFATKLLQCKMCLPMIKGKAIHAMYPLQWWSYDIAITTWCNWFSPKMCYLSPIDRTRGDFTLSLRSYYTRERMWALSYDWTWSVHYNVLSHRGWMIAALSASLGDANRPAPSRSACAPSTPTVRAPSASGCWPPRSRTSATRPGCPRSRRRSPVSPLPFAIRPRQGNMWNFHLKLSSIIN